MFKKFISYYRNHLGLFILDMIAALLMAGIDLVYPYFTGIFMDDYIPNGNFISTGYEECRNVEFFKI